METEISESEKPLRVRLIADWYYTHYLAHSFISERGLRIERTTNALVELQTSQEPFDVALFHELDAGLIATGRTITEQIGLCVFDLAARTAAETGYHDSITYLE
jgi:hypothetical protein